MDDNTSLPTMDELASPQDYHPNVVTQSSDAEYVTDRPNVFGLVHDIADNDWITSTMVRHIGNLLDPAEYDEAWDPQNDATVRGLFEEYQVPINERFIGLIRNTGSEQHARRVLDRIDTELENERRISLYFSGDNGSALAARFAVNIFDPAALVSGAVAAKVATAGQAARQALSARTVLQNSSSLTDAAMSAAMARPALGRGEYALRNSLAAAAADGSLEYYHISQSPTASTDDMVLSGLGVLASAGIFGHLGYSSARRSIYTRAAAEVEEGLVGRMETVNSDALTPDAEWDPYGGSSVGANRNPDAPRFSDDGDVITDPVVEEFDPGQGTSFGGVARFDAYAMFNRSALPQTRALGHLMFEDGAASTASAGRAQHHTVELLASRHERVFGARFATAMSSAFDRYKTQNNIGMASDAINADHYNGFSRQVAMAVRGDPNVRLTPEIIEARDAFRASMREQLAAAQKHGILDGVEANELYVPRFWRREAFLEVINSHRNGEDILANIIAKGIRGTDVETADSIARHVIKVITRSDVNNDTLSRMSNMSAETVRAKLRGLLGDVDDETLEAVNSILGLQGSSKRAADGPRAESRLDLDESASIRLNGREFALADLFNNDLLSINTMYSRQIGGRVGFSQASGGKIKTTSDIERLLADATEQAMLLEGSAQKSEMTNITRMKAYADYLLGHGSLADNPHLSDDVQAFMKFLRDVSFARLMGQVGYSQLSEIGTAVGALGFRAFLAQAPAALKQVFRNYKPGASPSHDNLVGVLSDTLALGDMHIQARMRTMSRQLDTENAYGNRDTAPGSSGTGQAPGGGNTPESGWRAKASLAARLGELGARATSLLGGLQPITDFSQMATGTALLAQFARNAKAGLPLNTHVWGIKQNPARLLGMGIDDEWNARITSMLNEASVYNSDGSLKTLNIGTATDQEAVDHMLMSIYRESRRIIQEGDLGSSRAEFAGPIVRTLLQFRSFVLNSHVKQMMYGANMLDVQTGTEFLMSTLFSGIGQMSKYQLMTLGMGADRREEYLEYALGTPGEDRAAKVMASALRYSSHIGLLPDVIDTITQQAIGQRFFDYRNTGMSSGWIGLESAPAWNTLTAPLQPINELSQGDTGDAVRDAMRIGPNYTPLIILGNALQEAIPDRPRGEPSSPAPRRREPLPAPREGSSSN